PAFAAVKLIGAAYLIWLGAQALREAWRGGGSAAREIGGAAPRLAPAAAFRQGVVNNLGNPKMAAFFPSPLPQFAPGDQAAFPALLLLGLLFCGMTLGWLTGYAFAVARAGAVMDRPGIRRAVEGLTGAVLIGLGVRLASEHR